MIRAIVTRILRTVAKNIVIRSIVVRNIIVRIIIIRIVIIKNIIARIITIRIIVEIIRAIFVIFTAKISIRITISVTTYRITCNALKYIR